MSVISFIGNNKYISVIEQIFVCPGKHLHFLYTIPPFVAPPVSATLVVLAGCRQPCVSDCSHGNISPPDHKASLIWLKGKLLWILFSLFFRGQTTELLSPLEFPKVFHVLFMHSELAAVTEPITRTKAL